MRKLLPPPAPPKTGGGSHGGNNLRANSLKRSTKSFTATLERGAGALKWVIIHVPFDIGKAWGVRGQLRVKGEINGFAFRTSLFPDGDGGHYMCVNKTMQTGG